MHKIARLPEEKRTELFHETAAQKGMTPAIAEKDFWVTFVLERIFSDEKLSSILIFKGGTSLSKVYGVIERFSEDIDLELTDFQRSKRRAFPPSARDTEQGDQQKSQRVYRYYFGRDTTKTSR